MPALSLSVEATVVLTCRVLSYLFHERYSLVGETISETQCLPSVHLIRLQSYDTAGIPVFSASWEIFVGELGQQSDQMPALKPSAGAAIALIGRALSLCCQLYSLAAEIMGTLMYVVIFHFPLAWVTLEWQWFLPGLLAVCIGVQAALEGHLMGGMCWRGVPLRRSWEQDTQFLAR